MNGSQPDWAQSQGLTSVGAAHSKFMAAPKVGGFPPLGGMGMQQQGSYGLPPGMAPGAGSLPPRGNPLPKGPPAFDPSLAHPKQGWPGSQLHPPLGSSAQPPMGLQHLAPPMHTLGSSSPTSGGLEQEESSIMRQLLSLQSELASKNSALQPGLGAAPMPMLSNPGMLPTNGPNSFSPMRPNNAGNMFGQQQNNQAQPQAGWVAAGQMPQHQQHQQQPNMHQHQHQRPQGMMHQHAMRPQGMMQQQNFRPQQQPFAQQNSMMHQNTSQPHFNQQFGGMRPPNNMQPNSMQQNHMQQGTGIGQQSFQPTPGVLPNFQPTPGVGSGLMQPQPGLLGVPQPQPGLMGLAGLQPGLQGPRGPMTHAQAKMAPPPPPPSPPAEGLARTTSAGEVPKARSKDQGPAFGKRFMELRKEYPTVEVPSDMWTYALSDLEAYFKSKGAEAAAGQPMPPAADQAMPPADQERKSPRSSRKRKAMGPPPEDEMQYSPEEALDIQGQLQEGFGHRSFQDELRRLQDTFPKRKDKGHKDMASFVDAFENLTLSVFTSVLPRLKFDATWDGVREMIARMDDALKHPKVKKTQEEINVLMGLPRNAIFQPPRREQELFIFHPDCDAEVPSFTRPTVMDEDGDEGHEFFVEDPETGELKIQGPTALEDADCWYVVLHKPSVVLRSKPDVKADMVGRKKTGKRVRVQRVVDNQWAQLHAAELVRLGVKEAWAPVDGAIMDLPGQKMLEREA